MSENELSEKVKEIIEELIKKYENQHYIKSK